LGSINKFLQQLLQLNCGPKELKLKVAESAERIHRTQRAITATGPNSELPLFVALR